MFEIIAAGVIAGLIVPVIIGLWRRRNRLWAWLRHQRLEAAQQSGRIQAERLDVLREQVVGIAREKGLVIPVSSSSTNPTAVTFSDGGTRYYFTDLGSYQRALKSRSVPLTQSFRRTAPNPVSGWTWEELMHWIDDHAEGGSSDGA